MSLHIHSNNNLRNVSTIRARYENVLRDISVIRVRVGGVLRTVWRKVRGYIYTKNRRPIMTRSGRYIKTKNR